MGNLFLKVDGLKGESQDAAHKDEIEIFSFSWGESQSGSTQLQGQGKSSGVVSMDSVSLTTSLSKASPDLMLACATGKHFKNAIIYSTKAGDKKNDTAYLTLELSDVMISSYTISGADNDIPMESFGLQFSKISMEYKEQDATGRPKGSIKKTYDLSQKKAE